MSKQSRRFILLIWISLSGAVGSAFLAGWHPTCDDPGGMISDHRATDRVRSEPRPWSELDTVEDCLATGMWNSRRGRKTKALACFQKAIALDPDHVEAHALLGICYMGLSRKAEAITAFERAVTLDPDGVWGKLASEYLAELLKE